MRSLAFLLLATLAVLPTAQASPVDPALEARTLVVQCLTQADPQICIEGVVAYVNNLCGPGASGCFVCLEFAQTEGPVENMRELVNVNPFGDEKFVEWFGYFYRSTHDVLVPGIWTLSWGKSEGRSCSAAQLG